MTKEEVLQKVNDYCGEKSYTSETLTDDFKEKFSDFFAKKYPEDTAIDADGVLDDIKFNINTAFSATSKGITSKVNDFSEKEKEYQRQIEELNKKITKSKPKTTEPADNGITKELQEKLDKLEKFEIEARKREKFKDVLELAKKNVRTDLHKSFEKYAQDFEVNLDETSEEQSKKLFARFQEIFKDSIGDIKPLAPKQTQKRDEEFLSSLPKIKI